MAGTRKLIAAILAFGATAHAAYTLQDNYDTTNFFDGFDFFSGQDPTNGFVKYADASSANSAALAGFANNGVYLGVDSHAAKPDAGRSSVRVSSKKKYNKGLIVADIAHMPGSICGVWPAFWTFSASKQWPAGGEIDIIEGVNAETSNTQTLHTGPGCTMKHGGDCNAGNGNTGCSTGPNNDTKTYGDGFNQMGGGVHAMEWTSDAISMWFFPRTAPVPADIAAGKPDPSGWGKPTTQFSGGCNIDEHFQDHQIVFNTAFCGDWAGKVWEQDATCKAKAPTCDDYVAQHPGDFKEAYWLINSVKVFSSSSAKADGAAAAPPPGAGQQPKMFRA